MIVDKFQRVRPPPFDNRIMPKMAVNESDFFRGAALQIFSSLDMDTALKRCMKYLEGYMPVSGLILGYHEPELEVFRIVASITPSHRKKLEDIVPLPGEINILLKTLDKRRTHDVNIINDPEKADLLYREAIFTSWPGGEASALHMALDFGTERIGHLSLLAAGKHRYKEIHAHLLFLLNDLFAVAISKILQHQEIIRLRDMLAEDNLNLRRRLEISRDTIIGADLGLKAVMKTITQVTPLNSPVLLLGETGTGKEVLANAIHYGSQRKNNPFVKVNCGAIPETLIDSELFGHEKGAFTGAIGRKLGYFEQAHTGTIFLDEIGELPPSAQVRLLRVLQQHEIQRVGGTQTIPVDVRLVSATHRNLEEMVQSGLFRKDLWFRLNVIPIMIPPLRERPQDIPALLRYFIEQKSKQLNILKPPILAPGTLEYLLSYHWPGNIRELENIVERALVQGMLQGNEQVLRFEQTVLRPTVINEDKKMAMGTNAILTLNQININHIHSVLAHTNGKVEGADGSAAILGVNPGTLRARMKKLGIPYGRKFSMRRG